MTPLGGVRIITNVPSLLTFRDLLGVGPNAALCVLFFGYIPVRYGRLSAEPFFRFEEPFQSPLAILAKFEQEFSPMASMGNLPR